MQTGECIYCGQTYQIDAIRELTEEELNLKATELCDCEKAKAAAKEKETISVIDDLFKEKYPDTAEILKAAVLPIKAGEMQEIQVKVSNCTKAKLFIDAKDNIKCQRITNIKTEKTV